MHAVIGGNRPPLLLVHGRPQTWYAWRLLMPAPARDFTVIAVDQRGIGLSDKPQGGYDTITLADDLLALMDALGHQRFAMVGNDIGMPIDYALAADHPERLDRLVVAEAFLPGIRSLTAPVCPRAAQRQAVAHPLQPGSPN
ncbi:alpha/beta fold hydrolase [Streptomyces sp. NPDC001970]